MCLCAVNATWIFFHPGVIISEGERRVGPSQTTTTLMFKVVIGFLINLFLFISAELGRDAMSIQAAPHDPGTRLQ